MTDFEEKITYLPNGTHVQIDYKRERDGLILKDAYTMRKAEYESMTEAELDDILDAKFETFCQDIENPSGVTFIDGVAHVEITLEEFNEIENDNKVEIDNKYYIVLD